MKLFFPFLFTLTAILCESFPQNKIIRQKRQSPFLEGLGGPLALKPRTGKNDTIKHTASPAEVISSQTTAKTVPTTTATTRTTKAPISTTESTKIKQLKAKPKLASTPSVKTTTTKAPMPTESAKARIQVPKKPTIASRPAESYSKSKPTTVTAKHETAQTTYISPSPCCHSWDVMKAILFGRCAYVTSSNCQQSKQQTTEQRSCENLNNANMDKLKREIFQEIAKQLDSLKKDIMSALEHRQS